MEYRKTSIAQDEALAASAVLTADMGVNPISHLLVTMNFLNVTDEATLTEILARFGTITVTRFGETIFNMSAVDLYKWNMIWFKNTPILTNQVATDNAARSITLIVPFSRITFSPNEGLPKTLRGEMQAQISAGSSDLAVDNATIQIEQVEMLGANPSSFLKVTSLTQTMVSGVDNDIALPIGNKYASFTVFSTTIPTGTSYTTTADKLKFLLDNVEFDYVSSQWESFHGGLLERIGHRQDIDASADDDDLANYGIVDFSPNNNDEWLVESAGKTQSTLKITAGDANAVRVMVAELVKN